MFFKSNFCFTTSQTSWHIRVVSRVTEGLKTYDLRKLGNIRKVTKLRSITAWCLVFLKKGKSCSYYQKSIEKVKFNFSRSALFHVKTRVGLNYFANDFELV